MDKIIDIMLKCLNIGFTNIFENTKCTVHSLCLGTIVRQPSGHACAIWQSSFDERSVNNFDGIPIWLSDWTDLNGWAWFCRTGAAAGKKISNFEILYFNYTIIFTYQNNDTPWIGQSRDISYNVLRNKTGHYSSALNSMKTVLNNIWPLETSHLKLTKNLTLRDYIKKKPG